MKTHLLIIDPQNDFCDLPEDWRPIAIGTAGERVACALPVAGAHADMLRLAGFIDGAGDGLDAITITLDSHQRVDIAHPTFWRQGDGSAVAPFAAIAAADLRAGRFLPRGDQGRVLAYLDALEAAGRYRHMVWPVHCEIGTWGHNVHEAVRRAYNRWEERRGEVVAKVVKGTNPWTEHYSAIQAEVPDPADPATQANAALVARLKAADRVLVAGEAGSHCVKATVEHLADAFGPRDAGKLVLLTDCMSPVAGFEAQFAAFLEAMGRQGVGIARSGDILPGMTRR